MNRRFKNFNWSVPETERGTIATWEGVQLTILMDIRDELQTLNRLLGCRNFTDVPAILREISSNTKKRKRAPNKVSA